MDIHFLCPWCAMGISVDEKQAGETVECANCNLPAKVPPESTNDGIAVRQEQTPKGSASHGPIVWKLYYRNEDQTVVGPRPHTDDVLQVSDVSRVTLLRKRLGNAGFSMKVIGLISAIGVAAYGSGHVHFVVALAFGILLLWFAFRLSKRLRSGDKSAARFITLWVVLFLAWALFVVPPFDLKGKIDFYSVIGATIIYLPIYLVIRGLLDLRAYRSALTSSPGKFEPLTLNPWENGGQGVTRKHPKFLNKRSFRAYVFVLLAPLLWLFFKAAASNSSHEPSSPAERVGYDMAGFVMGVGVWSVMIRLYRRGRRHAMLPGNKLLKSDTRDPVLYLRAFLDDSTIKLRARANDGRIFPERFVKISFEELVTDHLWRYGPVVAIGDPRAMDKLAPLGAARDFERDDTWQQKATDLMQQASIIAAIVGQTEGFLWEINTIIKLGIKSKLVLLLPPVETENLSVRWDFLLHHVIGVKLPLNIDLARTRALIFPEDQVVAITADGRDDWTYETVLDNAAELIFAR
jgi:hypothetical protein